jgi:hypothetical protein
MAKVQAAALSDQRQPLFCCAFDSISESRLPPPGLQDAVAEEA